MEEQGVNWKEYFSQTLPESPDKPHELLKAFRAARLAAIKKQRRVRFSPVITSTPARTSSAVKKLFPIFQKGYTPTETTPNNSSRNASKIKPTPKKLFLKSNEQYALDVGQKNFDAVTCKTCRMVYTPGEITDEEHHAQYHDTFVQGVRFPGWKTERVVNRLENGRIIMVQANDRKNMLKKVDDLFTVADLELGIRVPVQECLKDTSVFLIYVSLDKRVAGFLAAEQIKEGFKLVSDDPLTVSLTPSPAAVGVARLWVHPNYRRSGVATELLDTLRISFRFDRKVQREEIAFSDPTNEGRLFAQRYIGVKNFLVFHYQPMATPNNSQNKATNNKKVQKSNRGQKRGYPF